MEVVMELHMHSHRWEQHSPDWTVAAVSGFAAGAVLMVLELLWSTIIMGTSPWETSHMVAAITMGQDALQSTDFDLLIVAAALITHYVLGIVFALILSFLIVSFRFDSSVGMALVIGAVFGAAMYLFNFYGMAQFFPWFAEMRSWATVVAHMIFGTVVAIMYWKLEQVDR
jgi:lipopolysaccharide export LptBFGC system permease protein LptF